MKTSPIIKNNWDIVILDEATMTPPAICVYLGTLAKKCFLLAGDPRQLGPVYKEDYRNPPPQISKEWMGSDIFERSGISSGKGEQRRIDENDSRLIRITCQRRCDPGIWLYVKHLYPEVSITSNTLEAKKFNNINPAPGKALVLLDTSTNVQNPKLSERWQRSWRNKYTAETAFEVASSIASESEIPKDSTIAIISPYRAQVQLIRKWIKEERGNGEVFKNVEVGTVHQFQGSAADVVVFDIVDGPGRTGLGSLLKDDNGLRLVNVAITRARYKVIILADKEWFRRYVNKEDNPLLYDLILGRPIDEEWSVVPAKPERDVGICESPIEEKLYKEMQSNPILSSVKPQVRIFSEERKIISRADFAFEDLKLAIYCDGAQWHCKISQWHKDIRQRNELSLAGWEYLVFAGREINKDPKACVDKIVKLVSRLKQKE